MNRRPRSQRGRVMRGVSELARSSREGAMPIAPRIAIAGIIGAVLFGILLLRLWALTVIGGAQYAERADRNQLRLLPREAPRGKILDRNGEPLVANREAQQVVLDLQDIDAERVPSLLRALAPVLRTTPAKLQAKVDKSPPGAVEPVVLAGDVLDMKPIWYLQEHKADFPGIDVRKRFQRTYAYKSLAAHILGQVGQVSEDQLKTSHTNLKSGDRVGKSGVEATYDEFLRGTDGYDAVLVNAAGVREGTGRQQPAQPGRNLKLSIDLPLQQAAEQSLRTNIARAAGTAKGRDANGGAVVAIDPHTGEILVSASAPTFDANMFVNPLRYREVERLYADEKRKPATNRAIEGSYPPGSIYKPITAIAAMDQGWITPDSTIDCPGYMDILGQRFKNHESDPRGKINLSQSLETSCDTYYYVLGLKFYNAPKSPLQTWSRKFGLGAETGVDIPGEGSGLVPTPAWKREAFAESRYPGDRIWTPGNSVNLSIGQGDLLTTPLQMANVFASLANGGTKLTPHFGTAIEDPSGRKEFAIPQPKPVDLGISPVWLEGVKEGLVAVNTGVNGTARGTFALFEVPTAGKSGTAEKGTRTDLAWYCGFAPVEKPEIAACAFVDGGGGGSAVSAPIVRDIFATYFGPKHQKLVKRTAMRAEAQQAEAQG